jgi:DNA polymerase I-like protein with 3'-5' exonuclease and polymerase domains
VADIIHRAARKLEEEYPWIILLLNNHDSLVYEAPTEKIEEAIRIVEEYLQEPVVINGEKLSIPADTEIFEEYWEKR